MNILTRKPRILEDAPRTVVVESKTRRALIGLAINDNPIDHAVAAVALGGAGDGGNDEPPKSAPENAYPGGKFSFIRPGDILITADQAAQLALHCVHPLQHEIRPLDHKSAQHHIATLAAIMRTDGAWMSETQLRLGVLFGRLWIMDGNHRIRGQATAGVPISWNIKIDEYSSEGEFAQAFHKFNTNSRSRTESQILGATGFAEHHGIAKQIATAVYNAMPYIIMEFKTGKMTEESEILRSRVVDTRLRLMDKFVTEAVLFNQCLHKADSKVKRKLLGAGVTAVAMATLKAKPEEAKQFWAGVARNDGLKKGDPRHTLVMDLMTRVLSKGAGHQAIYAPAAAWNAWYEGRSLSIIKVLDAKAVRIAGTTYKG